MARAMLLLVLVSVAVPAAAQEPDETDVAEAPVDESAVADNVAQQRFQAGQVLFAEGRYDEAIVQFEQSYALSQRPLLLYNIYLAYERSGDVDNAIIYLERYLPDASDEDRPTLELRLENLRARARGDEVEDEPDPAPVPETSGGGVSAGAIVGFSIGGAGLVTFGVFAVLAMLEDSDLAGTCGADMGARCSDDDVSTLETFSLVADIGIGVAAAGALTGLLFLLLDSGGDEPAPVAATPFLGPDRAGVGVRGSF